MNRDLILKIILKYIWVIAIAGSSVCAVTIGLRMKETTTKERIKMMLGTAFWLSVTWLIMGIGFIIGGVPSIWNYLRPRDGNSYVLVWWASVLVLYIIGSYWIFVGQGAAKLAKSGAIQYRSAGKTMTVSSEKSIKLIFLLDLAGAIIFTAVVWFVNIPLPPNVK
ncbi:MAG: hypothetical protein ABSH16_09720 [Sedimentisphaerales bacterium]